MILNKIVYYLKTFILIMIFFSLGFTENTSNALIVANANDMKSNIPEFKISFELESITIKEDEEYQIVNFIPKTDLNLLTDIDYNYKEESMSTYKDKGKYEIVIIFKNNYGSEVEKSTYLTIEKRVSENIGKNNSINSSKKTTSTSQTIKVKKDIESQILDSNKKLGTQGRLYFSSLYSVALYKPTSNSQAQNIVDKKDSAAYFKFGNVMIIADHVNQGFDIIKKQKVGNYVYIKKKTKNGKYTLIKYVVREKTIGKNIGSDLITKDNRSISKDVNCSLVLYTCNSKKNEVTILLLDKA